MDFAGERPHVERLDPALLPDLYLAWRSDAAETSHAVHGGLRERADDPAVRAGMARLAGHARTAATRCAAAIAPPSPGPWTPRSTSARRSWTSTIATWRWCAPRAPPAPAPTTPAQAGLSWVPCRQPASSLSWARCARWAARSSRRVWRYDYTRAAVPPTERQSACPSRAQTTSSRSRTRRLTASRRNRQRRALSRARGGVLAGVGLAAALERHRGLRDPLHPHRASA